MEPIAITGVGLVSPIATGWDAWCAALANSKPAAERAFQGASVALSNEKFPDACTSEVRDFDATTFLGEKGLRNFDRMTKFMIVAAKHALEDAGLKSGGEFTHARAEQVGIVSATAYGSLDAITELNLVAELEDPRYINPARFPNTVINAAAGYVSIWENLRAPNVTIVDGNCGAIDALLSCETHLRHRRGDMFLVGGAEVVSEPLYLAFKKLGSVADQGVSYRPGDPTGVGLRLGEGALYLCSERLAEARTRKARIRGLALGYGTAFDPPESEALLVHSSSDAVARAVRAALLDARIKPEEIDLVVTSESGLGRMDDAERIGLRLVLGERPALVAPKMLFGETFGASGAFGMGVALAFLSGVPVTALTGGDAPRRVRTVVVTAVGYYGNVSAAVIAAA